MEINTYFPVVTQYEMNLPFYITSVGYGMERRNQRNDGLKEAQLLFTSEGMGRCYVNEQEIILPEKSIFYMPPYTPHTYWPEGVWVTYWITFDGYATEKMISHDIGVSVCSAEFNFEEKIKQIMSFRNTNMWSEKSSILLYELLLNCSEIFPKEGTLRGRLKTKLSPVFSFIQNHYQENISLEKLASICGVSKEHFCKLFREFTGMRPLEYISDMRIQAAKNLLLYRPDLKIEEIGNMVGYESNSYFSKMFKSIESITPAQFRNYR